MLELEVAVLDRDGRPVDGLTRDDFEVFLANRPAEVTNFYGVRSGAMSDEAPMIASAAKSQAKRETLIPTNVIIVVDDTRLEPRAKRRALEAVSEYIKANVGLSTSAMLVRWNGGNLDVRTRPTERPGLLLAELDILAQEPGQLRNTERQQLIQMIDLVFSADYDPDTGRGERPPMEPDQLRNELMRYGEAEARAVDRTIAGLREVVRLASAFDGRRAVLYISEGLPLQGGVELFDYWTKLQYSSNPNVNTKVALWAQKALSPVDAQQFDRTQKYQQLSRDAQRANVLFFAIDAGGLRTNEGSNAETPTSLGSISTFLMRSNVQEGLRYLAKETGGRFIANDSNLGRALAMMSEQYTTYYSLGVRAPASTRLTKVSVRVKNRPQLRTTTARYRRPLTREEDLERSVRTHLYTRLIENPFGLTLGVGVPSRRGEMCTVPVSVRPHAGKIWFALLDERMQESDVRTSSDPQIALGVRPGKYVLSVAVVATSGETSYLQQDIECR
ncbi:MAG TPA: VWA domain-containing protein [Thermoanaerobaculia bacterium]|nr:VWA domain-containing protein [Thermoanaerobaculia bacterium]